MSLSHRRRQPSHRRPGRTAAPPLRSLALTAGAITVAAGIGAGVAATHPEGGGTAVADAGPASDRVVSSASPMAEDATPTSPSPSVSKRASPLRTGASGKSSPGRTAEQTRPRVTTSESAPGATAPPRKQTRQSPTAPTGEAARVLQLVNQERAKAGCSPLTTDPKLTAAAEEYSDVMANAGVLSHTGPDGSQISDRVEQEGYAWSAVGENIAQGQPDADAVMDAWMDSPGHRQNILNCNFQDIGIGIHEGGNGPWWTQDFGTAR